jgi:hypothetical protein
MLNWYFHKPNFLLIFFRPEMQYFTPSVNIKIKFLYDFNNVK